MKLSLKAVLFVIAALLPFAGQSQEKIKLRFSESTTGFSFLQSNVPAILNFYQDEGIEAEYIKASGAATGINALISGDIDVYIGSTDALLKAQARGAPIVAIAALTTQFVSGIVVSRSWANKMNINENTPLALKLKALQGAVIGITGPGSGADQIVRYAAGLAGIDPDKDMQIVAMGNQGANFLAALQQQRIDGFALSAPTSYQAIKDQNAMMLVNSPEGEVKSLDGYLYIVAAVRRDWLKENPGTALKLLLAFQRGLDAEHDPLKDAEVREKVRLALYPNIEKSVFDTAWEDNKQAVPKSVVITPTQMNMALGFANKFLKEPLSTDLISTSYDDDYAEKAYAELHPGAQ